MHRTVEEARRQLLARRAEVFRRYQQEETEGRAAPEERPPDWVDLAVGQEANVLMSQLAASERAEVEAIDGALKRIAEGTWGWCTACGNRVESGRLKALPEARMCLGCSEVRERRP